MLLDLSERVLWDASLVQFRARPKVRLTERAFEGVTEEIGAAEPDGVCLEYRNELGEVEVAPEQAIGRRALENRVFIIDHAVQRNLCHELSVMCRFADGKPPGGVEFFVVPDIRLLRRTPPATAHLEPIPPSVPPRRILSWPTSDASQVSSTCACDTRDVPCDARHLAKAEAATTSQEIPERPRIACPTTSVGGRYNPVTC